MKLKDKYGEWNGYAFALLMVAIIVGLCIVTGTPFLLASGCGGGANGEHVGYVTSVEDMDFLTWDSTLVHFKTDTESTQEDTYCVNDNDVAAKLRALAEERSAVVILYRNDLVMWRWECNGGDSIIVGVRKAKVGGK